VALQSFSYYSLKRKKGNMSKKGEEKGQFDEWQGTFPGVIHGYHLSGLSGYNNPDGRLHCVVVVYNKPDIIESYGLSCCGNPVVSLTALLSCILRSLYLASVLLSSPETIAIPATSALQSQQGRGASKNETISSV
jgi:hypothetical protein